MGNSSWENGKSVLSAKTGWVLNPFEELGKVSVVEVGNTIVLVKSIGAPHL